MSSRWLAASFYWEHMTEMITKPKIGKWRPRQRSYCGYLRRSRGTRTSSRCVGSPTLQAPQIIAAAIVDSCILPPSFVASYIRSILNHPPLASSSTSIPPYFIHLPRSDSKMKVTHTLFSGLLLLLPIAVTVGIYIGLNVQQIFHSGFKGSYGIPIGSGPITPKSGTYTYCQKSIGITPQNKRYTCKSCFSVPAVARPLSDVFALVRLLVGVRFICCKTFLFGACRKSVLSIRIR